MRDWGLVLAVVGTAILGFALIYFSLNPSGDDAAATNALLRPLPTRVSLALLDSGTVANTGLVYPGHGRASWTNGHRLSAYEQYTQQSDAFGRISA